MNLEERIARQNWTAHNIRLPNGVETIPGHINFLSSDVRLHAILRTLNTFYGNNLKDLRIADLGCLEGGYGLALAQRGAHVVGIEAREQNLAKCQLLNEYFPNLKLQFNKDDVKNFKVESYGEFDTVLALGIAYHLDNPVQWLSQIASTVKNVLILETHFAPMDGLSLLRPELNHLGDLETMQVGESTYSGRWFFEFPESTDVESQLWASYSNNRSFWLTKESLLLAVRNAGFSLIFEQHDYKIDKYQIYETAYPRCMIIAVKG